MCQLTADFLRYSTAHCRLMSHTSCFSSRKIYCAHSFNESMYNQLLWIFFFKKARQLTEISWFCWFLFLGFFDCLMSSWWFCTLPCYKYNYYKHINLPIERIAWVCFRQLTQSDDFGLSQQLHNDFIHMTYFLMESDFLPLFYCPFDSSLTGIQRGEFKFTVVMHRNTLLGNLTWTLKEVFVVQNKSHHGILRPNPQQNPRYF